MNEKSQRIDFMDTVKGILMIFVVLGHVLIVLNPNYDRMIFTAAQSFIYSFHMAAFFMIHGILFNNEKYKEISVKEFILKKVSTTIVPYIFFEVIGMLCRMLIYKQPLTTGVYNMLTIRCNIGADWFLPALFMGSLLHFIYVKYPNRIYGIITTILSFILPMLMSSTQFTIVIGRGLLAYGFIMIGNIGKECFKSEKLQKFSSLLISLLITEIVAIIGLKWGGNDFYGCTVNNPITLVIGGISGTCLVIGISRILHNKLLKGIGQHTLVIMGTHQLVIYVMTSIFSGLSGGNILWGILLLGVIVVVEVPVLYLVERYLPSVVGKSKR